MNKTCRHVVFAVFALSVLGGAINLYAGEKTETQPSDRTAMEKVLDRYSRIHRDIVTASRGQIKDDASLLWVAAGKVMDKRLSSDIQKAAKLMISDSSTGMGHPSIPQAIDDFKKLSALIVEWVKKNKPEGWSVIYCSKLDASWVQKSDLEIQNPYSGEDIRSCGEEVS